MLIGIYECENVNTAFEKLITFLNHYIEICFPVEKYIDFIKRHRKFYVVRSEKYMKKVSYPTMYYDEIDEIFVYNSVNKF